MAGNRCESCERMVGLETGEPDDIQLELAVEHEDGVLQVVAVTGTCTVTRDCAECGTEMKTAEYSFENNILVEETMVADTDAVAKLSKKKRAALTPEATPTKKAYVECVAVRDALLPHIGDGHEPEIEADDGTADESGGGRYAKNVITVTVPFTIICSCQGAKDAPVYEGEVSADMAASEFEEV